MHVAYVAYGSSYLMEVAQYIAVWLSYKLASYSLCNSYSYKCNNKQLVAVNEL